MIKFLSLYCLCPGFDKLISTKRAIIVHCWSGYPDYCWYPSVKDSLERVGFSVTVPVMPDTDAPRLSEWLPKLKEVVGAPDEKTYLIGHSAGCITIMRYLESLPENYKLAGVVFVAGFTHDLGFEELKNFFKTPIDFDKIKSRAKHFVAIASNDDPFVPVDQAEVLKEKLGAEVIMIDNAKHFSGAADGEDSCTELPFVTESILNMS